MDDFESRLKDIHPTKMQTTDVYRLSVEMKSGVTAMGAQFPENYEKKLSAAPPKNVIRHLIREKFSSRSVIPQRWNDRFPCFYTALEPETAITEVGYSIRKHFGPPKGTKERKTPYMHFSCEFSGRVKDIRELTQEFPELVADRHNDACHRVARLVFQSGVEGLLAPSVRKPDGTCLPVYKPKALKPGRVFQRVVFVDKAGSDRPQIVIENIETEDSRSETQDRESER